MEVMQKKLYEFHTKMNAVAHSTPTLINEDTRLLRIRLIREEFNELIYASLAQDMVGIADALADIMYVVLGTACSYGIDMEPIFNEVHRSNMSKLWPHCSRCNALMPKAAGSDAAGYCPSCNALLSIDWRVHRDAGGKILKPPSYSPADLGPLLSQQMHFKGDTKCTY